MTTDTTDSLHRFRDFINSLPDPDGWFGGKRAPLTPDARTLNDPDLIAAIIAAIDSYPTRNTHNKGPTIGALFAELGMNHARDRQRVRTLVGQLYLDGVIDSSERDGRYYIIHELMRIKKT